MYIWFLDIKINVFGNNLDDNILINVFINIVFLNICRRKNVECFFFMYLLFEDVFWGVVVWIVRWIVWNLVVFFSWCGV